MWNDNWCSMGPLIQYLTHRDIYNARLNLNMKVCDMIEDGKWKWPLEWFDKFPLITSLEDPNFNADDNDTVVWICKNGEEGKFSVKNATLDLCTSVPKVHWWRLVWYSQCVPKHSFILWLAIQNRLSTQEKLQNWGIYNVNRCPLCQKDNEDLQHLFFRCEFSKEVWYKAVLMADINCDNSSWEELIKSMADECIQKNIGWVVKRLVLAACVYFLWQERNGRIFKEVQNSSQEVYNKVVDTVKCKLIGIVVKDSNNVRYVEEKWQVKCRRSKSCIE